jgi:hypothetical protein
MRPHRLTRTGTVPTFAALAALAMLGGCEARAPSGPHVVRRVTFVGAVDSLRPGYSIVVTAVPLNAAGEPVEAPVAWRSLTPTLASVTDAGEIHALAPGRATIRATAGGRAGELSITLANPPAAVIELEPESLLLVFPGPGAPLGAIARDEQGDPLVGAPVRFASEADRVAMIEPSGLVIPVAVGATTITAVLDGVQAARRVRVIPAETPDAPIVESVTPALLVPGQNFVIAGARFSPDIAGNSVVVDGIPAVVTSATPSRLTAILPAAAMPCLPTADVAVQVRTADGVGARTGRLRAAPQRELAVGDALVFPSIAAAACNEFAAGDGRYAVAVVNTERTLAAAPLTLTVEGRSGLADPITLTWSGPGGSASAGARDAHLRILDASGEATRRAASRPASSARPLAALAVPPVASIVPVRVPDLDAANFCGNFVSIGARTVWVGEHVVLLEDTLTTRNGTPTLAGVMDADIAALGAEIDTEMWPLVNRFGDPLLMDARLDANGRVAIVLTPALNAMANGDVLGAVVSCDFFPRSQFAASNVGEVVYLQVPTMAAPGFEDGTVARWRHEIRGTVMHELKHVVSFASRITRGLPPEEIWLEEATARVAEELFTRTHGDAAQFGNAGYATIRCEIQVRFDDPTCADTPRQMLPHLEGLWTFLDEPGRRTPLGPTSAGDASFYGSGWSLLRWAMDHAALGEDAFLLALVSGTGSGVANLEARAGRPWSDLLTRWALSLLVDDRGGVTASDPTLRFPSWAVGDLFAGLCDDLGPCAGGVTTGPRFTRAHPARPLVAPPDVTLQLSGIPAGGFVPIELLPGPTGSRRLLRLKPTGGALPAGARLAIIRIE